MRKYGSLMLVVAFCILLFTPVMAVDDSGPREILPVSKIETGMSGVGKTVISGTEVEEFKVEVLGVLKKQGVNRNLILIEVSGDVIEKTGGIAAGMSGSPIYINGKLIGAIGYGWQLTEHKVGMVTPIKDMLDLWQLDEIKEGTTAELSEPVEVNGKSVEQVSFVENKSSVDKDNSLTAYPAKTPLLVSGLDKQAVDYLSEELSAYDLKPVQSTAAADMPEGKEDKLVPGSAIAVQLARGDVDISAVGTLTYKEGDQVLGFGHQFMGLGDSNYFLSSAYIHHMIKSMKMPFKLGSPLNSKGIITQDRSAGVGGRIGQSPKVVPLEVNVTDRDLNKEQKINAQIIRNEKLLQSLASSVIYQAINSTIDRRGGGTAEVEMEIMANNLEEKIIKRKNIFYSRRNVASVALRDFSQALILLTQNPFQKINLIDINLDVDIKEKPQVALIKEVNVLTDKLKPGREVELEVTFQPYREETMVKNYSFTLPEDVESGIANMELVGGLEANFTAEQQQEAEPKEEKYGYGKNETFRNLEEVITAFKEQKINSDLVVRIYPSYNNHKAVPVNQNQEPDAKPQSEKEADSKEVDPETMGMLTEETFKTDYILEGRVNTEIEIESKSKENNDNTKE